MTAAPNACRRPRPIRRRCAGVGLAEMLVSLAITAALLTATMVAIDASFKAYASAAEQASAQVSTRLVTHRLLTLVRTSTAHGPLTATAARSVKLQDPDDPGVLYDSHVYPATLEGNTVASPYLELIDPQGQHLAIMYLRYNKPRPDGGSDFKQELWMITNPDDAVLVGQPLVGNVTAATFHCLRRKDKSGLWVLSRGSMDLTVAPDPDATLSLERGAPAAIRMVASTMPRKLD